MKGKGGQAIIFLVMLATVVVILALSLAQPIKLFTDDARNSTINDSIPGVNISRAGLDCATTNDTFLQGTCVVTDLYNPYFIGFLLALAGAAIGAKLIVGG